MIKSTNDRRILTPIQNVSTYSKAHPNTRWNIYHDLSKQAQTQMHAHPDKHTNAMFTTYSQKSRTWSEVSDRHERIPLHYARACCDDSNNKRHANARDMCHNFCLSGEKMCPALHRNKRVYGDCSPVVDRN